MKQKRMQESDMPVSDPKVSILIPVYNVEKYVERCILSVLGQTMQKGVEVIILNDCTPDRSMEIIQNVVQNHLKEGGMTVRVIDHKRNRGLAAVRNTLINNARGEYVWHIDSDDFVDSAMLEKMYGRAIETGADIVMTDVLWEYPAGRGIRPFPYSTEKEKVMRYIIRGYHSNLWNKLIRRSLYLKHGISATEGMDMAEDYGVVVPLCYAANKIEYVSGTFYHYVQYNTSSLTKRKATQKEIEGWLYHVGKIDRYLKEKRIEEYNMDLAYYKLRLKILYMKDTTGKMQEECGHWFPEIVLYKKELLRLSPGRTYKILAFLALFSYPRLFNFLLKTAALLGKKY